MTAVEICSICGLSRHDTKETGWICGNTKRFLNHRFELWKCTACSTIHAVGHADFADLYRDYPLNRKRPIDFFASRTCANLYRRLVKAGLSEGNRILDFGCGSGTFVEYLRHRKKQAGYRTAGYDPWVEEFAQRPAGLF